MKIVGIKTTLFDDSQTASLKSHRKCLPGIANTQCLVELTSDGGVAGVAIAPEWARQAIVLLAEAVVLGEEVSGTASLWHNMGQVLAKWGDGVFQRARAALDIALWDLKARARDEPLWKALGGSRPRANAYVGMADPEAGEETVAEWFQSRSGEYGFRGGKLAVGKDLETDLRRIQTMLDALKRTANSPELMIDAGRRWWPTESIRNIRRIESRFDLTFVEGAVATGDFLASKRVADSIRAAVCAGKELMTAGDYLPYFHHHAANVIAVDIAHVGITGALQMADTAYGFELPVTLSQTPGNIHVHLAAAMPNFMSMEVLDPGRGDGVISSDVRFESGWGTAGNTPGNGLGVNRELLSKSRVETGD